MKRQGFLPLAAAFLALAVLVWVQFTDSAVPTGAWGLSFQIEGQAPQGPATEDTLERYDAVYVGDDDKKVIYLTFDAGYENGCTAKILDTLKNHNVPAAFFLVGDYMERNPDLVRRMVDEGHIVGNHTMNHPDMSGMTGDAFQKEITGLEALLAASLPSSRSRQAYSTRSRWPPVAFLPSKIKLPGQSTSSRTIQAV